MSVVLTNLNCCDPPCAPIVTSGPPGTPGQNGTDGTDGTNGKNAFTTCSSFVMPGELATVDVTVADSSWCSVNQIVFASGSTSQGVFLVFAVLSGTSLRLKNLAQSVVGIYPDNSAPGTVFPAGTQLAPSGPQGPNGALPAGALLASNNLSDVNNAATSRTNLGLGSASTRVASNANGSVPFINDGAGLTNGEMLVANATGIESQTAANARSTMGLGSMSTQSAAAVAITGGTLNGTLGGSTPAAAAVTTLAASGAAALSGNVTHGAKTFFTTSSIQSLLAATSVDPNATKIRVVGNGGAVILTATPTISIPAADGQLLIIMGTDDTNTVTFQRESALAGSKLRLGAASRALGLYDTLTLQYDAASGYWVELAFTDNT